MKPPARQKPLPHPVGRSFEFSGAWKDLAPKMKVAMDL
jgi:hypothetical protein